jgi:hypothetical protein
MTKIAFAFALACVFGATVIAAMTGTVRPAAAANNYTCQEWLNTQEGTATPKLVLMGTTPVSGGTLEIAASACHLAAWNAFQADPFGTPATVCTTHPHSNFEVQAMDDFVQIAQTPRLYNRVSGYELKCSNGHVDKFGPFGGPSVSVSSAAVMYQLVGDVQAIP